MKRPCVKREYPDSPLIGVGAIIVDGPRVVLVKRAKAPAAGEWSIPGGLVELGESLEDAVAREAFEETGLEVKPVALVELLERIFPDANGDIRYHYVLADYRCIPTGGALSAGSDATEAVWAHRNELGRHNLARVTERILLKALESA